MRILSLARSMVASIKYWITTLFCGLSKKISKKLNMEAQSLDNETKTNPGQYLPDVLLVKW